MEYHWFHSIMHRLPPESIWLTPFGKRDNGQIAWFHGWDVLLLNSGALISFHVAALQSA